MMNTGSRRDGEFEREPLHGGGGGTFDRPPPPQRTLVNIAFFHEIDPLTVAEIEQRCRWMDLDKGDVLVEAGEQLEKVFFLLCGELLFSLHTRVGKTL